jgi:hypothetical protein
MEPFRYFHLCNHKFPITDSDSIIREVIVTNNGTFIDIIASGVRVEAIIRVTALRYDPIDQEDLALIYDSGSETDGNGFYDIDDSSLVDYSTFVDGNGVPIPLPTVFYSSYLHNRIRWNVVPPLEYNVKFKSSRTDITLLEVARGDCPRCQGNAWFVDILDQYGTMNEAVGIDRVAQRFLKDLLTQLGSNSLDFSYGTVLNKQLHDYAASLSDDKLADNIRLIISGVEDSYLSRQALEITSLLDSEILIRAVCESVGRDPLRPTRVIAQISLTTRLETRMLQIPL